MKILKSPKFLIFLIVFINFLGYGIVFPLLPLLTEEYGGNPLISGILIAVFSLMQMIAMPILGRLSDRYGRRPLLIFSLWGTVISFAMMGLTHSIFWLLIARIIDGISGGNLSIAQAYIADITDKKSRASGMGVLAAGITLGFIFGPLWGGLFSKISLSAPFIAATVFTSASIILTQFFLPESLSSREITYEKKHFHLTQFLRCFGTSPLCFLFIANLFLFWAQSAVFTTMSLFGKDVLHLTVFKTGLLFAFGGVLSAIIQGVAIGKAVKIIKEEKIFIINTLVGAVGFFIMFIGRTLWLFSFGYMVISIAGGFLGPVVQSLVSEHTSEHEQGGSMGLLQSFGALGRIFGPIAAGFLYETINPFTPAIMGSIVMGLVFIIGIRFLSVTKANA